MNRARCTCEITGDVLLRCHYCDDTAYQLRSELCEAIDAWGWEDGRLARDTAIGSRFEQKLLERTGIHMLEIFWAPEQI